MRLSELFVQTAILDTRELTSQEIIARLLLILAETRAIHFRDVPELFQRILRREQLGSTGVGRGLAVPHAMHNEVDIPVGVLAVCRPAVNFDSLDGEPVDIFTLMLGSRSRLRLTAFESLFNAYRNDDFVTSLRAATTAKDLRQVILQWDGAAASSSSRLAKTAGQEGHARLTIRKARFFACACAYCVWDHIPLDPHQQAIHAVERVQCGLDREADLTRQRHRVINPDNEPATALVQAALGRESAEILSTALFRATQLEIPQPELTAIAQDIWAPPSVDEEALDPHWLTWNDGTIPRIAWEILRTEDFAALPILADALEDAGCQEQEILNHLRQPGQHSRGCWAVDLALGMSVNLEWLSRSVLI